jgi:hypothetical protein
VERRIADRPGQRLDAAGLARPERDPRTRAAHVLALQRSAGNHSVVRWLARTNGTTATATANPIAHSAIVLDSVLETMRGQQNVYERCLFYYGKSLAEITTRQAERYMTQARDEADGDEAEAIEIAKTYASYDLKKVPEIQIPSCGDTSAAVRRLLLDAVFSEKPDANALSERLQAAQTEVMEIYRQESGGDTKAVKDVTTTGQGGVRGGIGPDALKAVILESRGAQLIQITVEGKGFGHIYDIEQIERERDDEPPQGYLIMSFVERYTLSQWMSDPKSQRKPLLEHVEGVKAMTSASSFTEACKAYARLYLLTGREDTFKEPATPGPVNVVFSAAPLDRGAARTRAESVKP